MKKFHAMFLACAVVASSAFAHEALADYAPAPPPNAGLAFLGCSYGASDLARVYMVKNTTGKLILKGSKIVAESTLNGAFPNDKRIAELTLPNDLNPSQSVEIIKQGQTNPGSCRARLVSAGKPDLVITSLAWTTIPVAGSGEPASAVRIVVKNRNSFANAGASKTRVQGLSCAETSLQSFLIDTPALAGGSSTTFVQALSNAPFAQAHANFTFSVAEADIYNNVKKDGSRYAGQCGPR